MDPSLTNLTFTDLRSTGEKIRLITRPTSEDDWLLEVYKINPSGLEEFMGFMDRHDSPEFVRAAVSHIAAEIKQKPVSEDSLHWLQALDCAGLIDIYNDVF